jgi:hypothetical protein
MWITSGLLIAASIVASAAGHADASRILIGVGLGFALFAMTHGGHS